MKSKLTQIWDLVIIFLLNLALFGIIALSELTKVAPTHPTGWVISFLRLFIGFGDVFIFPGYLIQLAIFPSRTLLDSIERFGLSLGFSVALIPIEIWLVDQFPWGLQFWAVVTCHIVIIFILLLIVTIQRFFLSPVDIFIPRFYYTNNGSFTIQPLKIQGIHLFFACVVVIGIFGLSWMIIVPKQSNFYSEFYLLGKNGMGQDYPRSGQAGVPTTVTVGVANQEGEDVIYRVRAYQNKVLIGESEAFALKDGHVWEEVLGFTPIREGENEQFDFYLFRDRQTKPYRSLRLFINVTQEPSP